MPEKDNTPNEDQRGSQAEPESKEQPPVFKTSLNSEGSEDKKN